MHENQHEHSGRLLSTATITFEMAGPCQGARVPGALNRAVLRGNSCWARFSNTLGRNGLMIRYRLWALCILALVWCIGASANIASAWEFTMDGYFSSTYELYSQQGANGFFGRANIDRSAGTAGTLGLKTGDFASLNGWVGKRAKDLVSGSDSAQHYQNLDIFPEIRLNRAIRFRGKYRLGDYGDPEASDYFTNTRPGRDVATSDGQWTQWWITARTPWGILVLGKRPELFGTGLQYNGACNATGEGVLLVSNYGPFRVGLAFQPFWQQPANKRVGLSETPYYNLLDKNGLRRQSTRAFMTYRSGPMDFGASFMVFQWHAGPESQNRQASRNSFVPYDQAIGHGCFYVKYFTGCFFLNSEVAFCNQQMNRIGKAPLYNESWRYMLETGILAGPAKVSLLYAFMPGADRRNGAMINKQPFINAQGNGACGIFQPYTFLLGYAYGSGANAFDLNRNGFINEAWVAAGRLDYAVAANLNLFGSFLWAERSSYGHGWGYIRPAQSATVTSTVNSAGNESVAATWTPYVNYKDNGKAPSIPDTALGWEIMLGANWKLLEKFQLDMLGSYWQPGKWFNYACIDRQVLNWDVPASTNNWGTNPDRTIDPVIALQLVVTTEF